MERSTGTVGLAFVFGLLWVCQNVVSLELPVWSTFSSFQHGAGVKSRSYLSEPITLGPGEVSNKLYRMGFPKGHIAIKGFDGELVDEEGNSVPLHQVYLHHWLLTRYHVANNPDPKGDFSRYFNSTVVKLRNDGICQDRALDQIFGLGAETRHTNYAIPDPYGIVIGDPDVIPAGFHEDWLLNVHAIDTRSALDRMGCTECRCDLYDVDVSSKYGEDLVNYTGGVLCCDDGFQCALAANSVPGKKTYYLKYTVHWVDWSPAVVPVRVYIFDVTDSRKRKKGDPYLGCAVEFDVPVCDRSLPSGSCVHTITGTMPPLPEGGLVVYGGGHLHAGGLGLTMYNEDGREVCTSEPFYGTGTTAGDEAGYIVGMSVCIPTPGTVKVYTGEKLQLQSRYSSLADHTGVMGLFYLLVADFDASTAANSQLQSSSSPLTMDALVSAYVTTIFGLAGVIAACGIIVVSLVFFKRKKELQQYERLG